jgi:hypothetical protein
MSSSTTEIFNAAGTQEIEPAFNYTAAVQEAWAMFPGIKDRLIFLDVYSQKLIYPGDPITAKDIIDYMNKSEDLKSHVAGCIEKKSHEYTELENNRFILIYTGEDQKKILGLESSLAKSLYFSFDHELAHAMIENAKDYEAEKHTPQLVESIADAFAAIRHFQRFGDDAKSIEKLLLMRAYRLFAGTPEEELRHFTSPVIEQILKQKDSSDYKNLSPEETMALARRMAINHCMNEKRSRILEWQTSEISLSLAPLMQNDTYYAWARALAEKILTTDQPDLFKWGSKIIQGHLEQKFYNKQTGEAYNLTGPDWDDVRMRLKERQAEYDANPSCFGMKLKPLVKTDNVITVKF